MTASPTLARIAVAAVSLLILWRVIHVNVGLYDDSGQPRLVPGSGMASAPSDDGQASLRRMLDENPAEIGALLAIAQERDKAGDTAGASKAYRTALGLAPLGREVLALAAAHFLRQEDPAGLELLGRLVANYPDTRGRAFPVMAELLARERFQGEFAKVASQNPAWLAPFMADACARGTDPAVLVPLVMQSSTSTHAVPAAAACVMDRLRSAGKWDEAYHLWLNLLPKERRARLGFVFNGGFEALPENAGFDWILQQSPEKQAGHTAEVVRMPGAEGQRVLRVAYNGKRQSGVPARQYLLLPPGDYELTGLARPEGIKAVRGIHWTVRCMAGAKVGAIVAKSERFLGSSDWRRFAMDVAVDGSCPGHVLQLEPVAEEREVAFVEGTAWFDALALRQR